MAECQSPEEESKVGAAAATEGSSAVSLGQDVQKESTTTSSPDTDSPVMVNVDVSLRLKMLSLIKNMLSIFVFMQLSDFYQNSESTISHQ